MISPQTETKFAQLDEFLTSRASGRWLVLSHDNPDPDALVSAAILGDVLKRRFKQAVTLAYGGIIGRAENQEMQRSLGVQFSRLRHINFKNYSHFALVDTQSRTGNNQLPDSITPDLVIDHHPQRRASGDSPLLDIRTDYGATASIVAEYLLASELPIPPKLATGLVYAIQSETQSFSRERLGPDRLLYDYFYPIANKRVLGRIQYPTLPLEYLRTLHHALENLFEIQNLVVCHLPEIGMPDSVPEIADLLVRLEGKTWCLTTGPFEGRIYLALRTTNTRANAGAAMRRIVGRRGKGGGHRMVAGGWFPLDGEDDAEAGRVQRLLTERLVRILRKDPSRLSPLRLT